MKKFVCGAVIAALAVSSFQRSVFCAEKKHYAVPISVSLRSDHGDYVKLGRYKGFSIAEADIEYPEEDGMTETVLENLRQLKSIDAETAFEDAVVNEILDGVETTKAFDELVLEEAKNRVTLDWKAVAKSDESFRSAVCREYGFESFDEYTNSILLASREDVLMEMTVSALRDAEDITINSDDYNNYCAKLIEFYGFCDYQELFNEVSEGTLLKECLEKKVWDTVISYSSGGGL